MILKGAGKNADKQPVTDLEASKLLNCKETLTMPNGGGGQLEAGKSKGPCHSQQSWTKRAPATDVRYRLVDNHILTRRKKEGRGNHPAPEALYCITRLVDHRVHDHASRHIGTAPPLLS